MYAVTNDEGKWLGLGSDVVTPTWTVAPNVWAGRETAERFAKPRGGRVVELIEAPAKTVVSEEEAEILDKIINGDYYPALVIADREYGDAPEQARLMRAYVNGWTVEKPKRWNVKVPYTEGWVYIKLSNGDIQPCREDDSYLEAARQFTAAEIEHYELTDCERVEVRADSARTTGEED